MLHKKTRRFIQKVLSLILVAFIFVSMPLTSIFGINNDDSKQTFSALDNKASSEKSLTKIKLPFLTAKNRLDISQDFLSRQKTLTPSDTFPIFWTWSGFKKQEPQLFIRSWQGNFYLIDPSLGRQSGRFSFQNKDYDFSDIDAKAFSGWRKVDKGLLYYSELGAFQTGWQQIDGKLYFFNDEGFAQFGLVKVGKDEYWIDPKLGLQTGWIKNQDVLLYFDQDTGKRKLGFVSLEDKGEPQTIFLDREKGLLTGWQEIYGKKYYFDPEASGAMVTGSQTFGDRTYVFDGQGALLYSHYEADGYEAFADVDLSRPVNERVWTLKNQVLQLPDRVEKVGERFVVVSIKSQMLWLVENGVLKLTTPVVTGSTQWTPTPVGSFKILGKYRNATLMEESPVNYWMPFTTDGYGIHDADNWRGSSPVAYSPDRYLWNGSHGCVNVPNINVAKVYQSLELGDDVFIY